ncbi:MAG: GNAT family N-acetyltransferase [Phycisphaerales bacterium]|nr:GNAT family N-acetyltransferase [Phycisphaerales bacterium]
MTTKQAFPTIESLGADLGPAIARHLEATFRSILDGPDATREAGFVQLVTGTMHPFGNFLVVSKASELDPVARGIDKLCGVAAPSAVIVPGKTPAALEALLTSKGFGLAEEMPAMAVDLDEVTSTALPSGYVFKEVGVDADDVWCEAMARGYEIPREAADAFGPRAAQGAGPACRTHYYAIEKDGRCVATSTLVLVNGLAGIYCVATLPDERRKGLGAHATAKALEYAKSLGFRTGVLQSSQMGHGVYERLGFKTHGGVPLYVRMPG